MKITPGPIALNRRSYDQIAARFAGWNAAMPEAVAQKAAAFLAQIPAGGHILDLGCGPGRDKAWFEGQGARVTGADLSVSMLREAQKSAPTHLCQMEMRALGFAGHSFAGVWCNAALLHLPKEEAPRALAEIARVLSPGGILYLSLQEGSGEGLEDNPLVNVQRFFARYQAAEVSGLLARAGFSITYQDAGQDEKASRRAWLWYGARRAA